MILHQALPFDALSPRPLPGVAPLAMSDWLLVDEAYPAQMAERARLLRDRRAEVLAATAHAGPALAELLDVTLDHLPAGFTRSGGAVRRPDGISVPLDRDDPLGTLGHLVQEDLCLMEPCGEVHALTAALLCFPAGWRLSEKIGRPLLDIHAPVPDYEASMARRVQRLFHGLQVGRPLWRFNALWYDDPALFQPRSATDPRPASDPDRAAFFRSERQCLLRLPKTRAVVFSIHTYVLARETIAGSTPAARPSG